MTKIIYNLHKHSVQYNLVKVCIFYDWPTMHTLQFGMQLAPRLQAVKN